MKFPIWLENEISFPNSFQFSDIGLITTLISRFSSLISEKDFPGDAWKTRKKCRKEAKNVEKILSAPHLKLGKTPQKR